MDTTASPASASTTRFEVIRARRNSIVRTAPVDELCRVVGDGPQPSMHTTPHLVRLSYRRFRLPPRPGWRTELLLSTGPHWDLAFHRGLGHAWLDLREAHLAALTVAGGTSRVDFRLPAPEGKVRVRLTGGADRVTLSRPDGVPVILRLDSGTNRLVLDGERYGALGGPTVLESHSGRLPPDHYDVSISGGSRTLTVDVGP